VIIKQTVLHYQENGWHIILAVIWNGKSLLCSEHQIQAFLGFGEVGNLAFK